MVQEIPWRDKIAPARWMDTHTVTLVGGPELPRLEHLEQMLRSQGERGLAWPARALFALRQALGLLLGWDDEKSGERLPAAESYFWKMSEDDLKQCLRTPGHREGAALVLWNDADSIVLEILNATCQAFAIGWVAGRQAHLAVFVIETKWWSKYYLALIEPFRKFIVYPALQRWIERTWKETYDV